MISTLTHVGSGVVLNMVGVFFVKPSSDEINLTLNLEEFEKNQHKFFSNFWCLEYKNEQGSKVIYGSLSRMATNTFHNTLDGIFYPEENQLIAIAKVGQYLKEAKIKVY